MTTRKLSAGAPFPDLTIDTLSDGAIRLGSPRGDNDWQLVLVYRGKHCPHCTRTLKELEPLVADFHDIGVDVVAVSADTRDRAEPHIAEIGVSFTVGIGLSVEQMRQLGLYISEPRSSAESPRPFAEPGLFVVNDDGRLQVTDISNAPFVRPDLSILLKGLGFIRDPENDYPIRGTLD